MSWLHTICLCILALYGFGFVACLVLHVTSLQMVTADLALFRSAVWPIWLTTGWPHGTPLPMD
jgi:hypothetical protein